MATTEQRIAVIGAGIAGLSAAWLLSRRHAVTVYEAAHRLGGHSHTVDMPDAAIDTGFIVYNEPAYPNLTALFRHFGVATQPSEMSFSVSLGAGRVEYAGHRAGLFAQKRNLFSPRFLAMLYGLARFYRAAPPESAELTLQQFLRAGGYGRPFIEDHLYPMIAAIWSCPAAEAGELPAAAFLRFCENHGLRKFRNRPIWRTVTGGSRAYVARLAAGIQGEIRLGAPVTRLRRTRHGVMVQDASGSTLYDQVVLACHADIALRLIEAPMLREEELLGAFRYTSNQAVLHTDPSFMPRRKSAWASWNYTGADHGAVCVTYWMNRLHQLQTEQNWFLTLNPSREPANTRLRQSYTHPLFDLAAMRAQNALWSLQGAARLWFCGAYFGAGFHEDALQAGLAVAEALGGERRPWALASPSSRIHAPQLLHAA